MYVYCSFEKVSCKLCFLVVPRLANVAVRNRTNRFWLQRQLRRHCNYLPSYTSALVFVYLLFGKWRKSATARTCLCTLLSCSVNDLTRQTLGVLMTLTMLARSSIRYKIYDENRETQPGQGKYVSVSGIRTKGCGFASPDSRSYPTHSTPLNKR